MSHFAFLRPEWPAVHEAAARAEAAAVPDPRTACFYARRALELLVHWVYKHDAAVDLPYQDNLSALVHEPTFQHAAGNAVFQKARFIVRSGNQAVHGPKGVLPAEAVSAVRELFHVGYWLARTYAKGDKPPAELAFDPRQLPATTPLPKQTVDQLQALEAQLRERDEKLSAVLADRGTLDAELARLRAEIAAAKQANERTPDTHDYSEEQTRDLFIDLLLKEAGWPLDQERDREFPVEGMPDGKTGRVDYVLWGDDGLPLGRGRSQAHATGRQGWPTSGQVVRRLPGDAKFGRRPVIFYSNGYEHLALGRHELPAPRRSRAFTRRTSWSCCCSSGGPAAKPLEAGRHQKQSIVGRILPDAGRPPGRPRPSRRDTAAARRCW